MRVLAAAKSFVSRRGPNFIFPAPISYLGEGTAFSRLIRFAAGAMPCAEDALLCRVTSCDGAGRVFMVEHTSPFRVSRFLGSEWDS